MDKYLMGHELYGDDFDPLQIAEWYADEREGYAELGAKIRASYNYEYHAWNIRHGYRHLRSQAFPNALGLGSAYGEEFLPIISRIQRLTIVDPSGAFACDSIRGVPVRYVEPSALGSLPFPDNHFDLATCFGVLHHIPNVTFVLSEVIRVLRPGACMLLREPIVSMGDWRFPRAGLTKRERGIPLEILFKIAERAGAELVSRRLCGFAPLEIAFRRIRPDMFNSRAITRLDELLSAMFAWNVNYHATSLLQRFRPTSAFLVLRKRQPQA